MKSLVKTRVTLQATQFVQLVQRLTPQRECLVTGKFLIASSLFVTKTFFVAQAVMEEADVRLTVTKKSIYEFERDIVRGAINQRTGKVVAEKVIRYFEDKISLLKKSFDILKTK